MDFKYTRFPTRRQSEFTDGRPLWANTTDTSSLSPAWVAFASPIVTIGILRPFESYDISIVIIIFWLIEINKLKLSYSDRNVKERERETLFYLDFWNSGQKEGGFTHWLRSDVSGSSRERWTHTPIQVSYPSFFFKDGNHSNFHAGAKQVHLYETGCWGSYRSSMRCQPRSSRSPVGGRAKNTRPELWWTSTSTLSRYQSSITQDFVRFIFPYHIAVVERRKNHRVTRNELFLDYHLFWRFFCCCCNLKVICAAKIEKMKAVQRHVHLVLSEHLKRN